MERRHRDASVAGRWKREHAALQRRVDTASHFSGYEASNTPGAIAVDLRRGEHLFMVVQHVELIEPGAERMESAPVLDTGIATITDRRVVFEGAQRTREWGFSKLVDTRHHDRPPSTSMEVENRKRVSAIVYDAERAADVRFMLDLAIAHHEGAVDAFRAGIEREFAQHTARRPSVHAGAWVWRGWARPVPTAIAALVVAGAVMYGTAGGGGSRHTASPLTAHGKEALGQAGSSTGASSITVAAPPRKRGASRRPTARAAAPTQAAAPVAQVLAQSPPASPSSTSCVPAVSVGPLVVSAPVCTVTNAL